MKTALFNRRSHRRGMTYMTVVVTMVVVGVMTAAYLKLVAVQNSFSARSQNWNRGIAVVEAGIEEAMAHLNKNGSPDSGGTVNLAALASDGGWTGDSVNGWYKWGYMDGDWYLVEIGAWDGTTTQFPLVRAASYVRHGQAYASLNPRNGGPMMAAINFPIVGTGSTYTRRLIYCGLTNNPTFTKALVAKHGIDLNGNNVYTDSYDSTNPTFSTNGRWDSSKRRDNGDVASNDTVTNTINVGNANVWGRIATGPSGTISIGPNGKVGNAAWQASSSKGIQPGYSTDDMNVEFPDVVVPSTAWGAMPAGGNFGGTSYNYIFNASGDYQMPVGSGNVSGKILINAPNVRILVQSGWKFSGTDTLVIGTNASVKIYLDCTSADMTGNGIVNSTGTPNQCQVFGTTKLTSLTVGGNGESTAVVYAPYADVTLNGGGNNDQDWSGSLMANSFRFVGHYTVHYDEALGRMGLWRGFTITSWNER